jgi:S1-C subfamily serine protease
VHTSVHAFARPVLKSTVLVALPIGPQANGSGFLISEDGIVVTNAHVIDGMRRIGAQRVELSFGDGRVFLAQPLASDARSDIGLLQVLNAPPLPYLRPGRCRDLEPGDVVHVLGAPLGGNLTLSRCAQRVAAVTELLGPLSRLQVAGLPMYVRVSVLCVDSGFFGHASYMVDDPSIDQRVLFRGQEDWSLLQVNCSIMEGNSGGPVVNSDGEAVGIVSHGKMAHGGLLAYAVSMDQALPIIESLRRDGYAVRGKVPCMRSHRSL